LAFEGNFYTVMPELQNAYKARTVLLSAPAGPQ